MCRSSSRGEIINSTTAIGGASLINIGIGLVRNKIIAILLGPTGVGLIGLYTTFMTTATAVASIGMGTVGTRQIAIAFSARDEYNLSLVRKCIFWSTCLLASFGAIVVWYSRDILAANVLREEVHASEVGWLALGVALSVTLASQNALLQGMRRINDMAKLTIFAAIFYTLSGITVLYFFRQSGLLVYVIMAPLVSVFIGAWYISNLPKLSPSALSIKEFARYWKMLLKLGIPFLAAGLLGGLVNTWIRIEIGDKLGSNSVGYYQVGWTISMQYIGFVLAAMGSDFYPRLAGVVSEHRVATKLVNDQIEIALLISAPILIAMIGLAPWVIAVLYSSEFMPAVDMLRWQILGDILRIISWPLGFVLLAAGNGKTYFIMDALASITIAVFICILLPGLGLAAAGIAFFISYVICLPILYMLAKNRIKYYFSTSVATLAISLLLIAVAAGIISSFFWWGASISLIFSIAIGVYSYSRITRTIAPIGMSGKIISLRKILKIDRWF